MIKKVVTFCKELFNISKTVLSFQSVTHFISHIRLSHFPEKCKICESTVTIHTIIWVTDRERIIFTVTYSL